MSRKRLFILLKALRVNQWIKNLVVFTAIIFSGNLFVGEAFLQTTYAFFVLCFLSSTSYVLNDIIDYQYDKKHPVKKLRPIASGAISMPEATFIVFILTLLSLIASLFFSLPFFFLSFVFILLHFFYSLYLKRRPVIDIFTISFSFMIRTLGGEVVTGYHIPIWLLYTIFFGSLFMATVKRHAELVTHGTQARASLDQYKEHLLDFLTNTFATGTILAYAFFTYVDRPPQIRNAFTDAISQFVPHFELRRWMMITIPLVVYGVSRYAQLLYVREEGERPEKIVTTDKPLIITMFLWGLIVIGILYVF